MISQLEAKKLPTIDNSAKVDAVRDNKQVAIVDVDALSKKKPPPSPQKKPSPAPVAQAKPEPPEFRSSYVSSLPPPPF